MDTTRILAYIEAHSAEYARRRRMYDYFDGKHAIRARVMADKSKPNNKLENGYPRMISTIFTGYMFGEPVGYAAEDGNLQALIDECFKYNDEAAETALLGLDASICGIAVEIHYIDADGIERFKRVDPCGCIPVYDDTIEAPLIALIRYYDVQDIVTKSVTRTVEVYEADAVRIYESTGGAPVLREERENFFGDVPAVVYANNSRNLGDFESEISLIDAYDKMMSEGVNDQEYFSDAYMVLTGVQGTTDEDIEQSKTKRTLLLPPDASAQFLIKQENDTFQENMKTRLNADIHKFSGCPDMTDQNFAGNASGVALRYKLLPMENIVKVKEREFKRGLQRRLELLCSFWALVNRGVYDWRDVTISFKRSMPENLQEIAQAVSTIGNLVSAKTRRALLPIGIDEETEAEQIAAEAEANLMLYHLNGDDDE